MGKITQSRMAGSNASSAMLPLNDGSAKQSMGGNKRKLCVF